MKKSLIFVEGIVTLSDTIGTLSEILWTFSDPLDNHGHLGTLNDTL